ncbi:hypothetical protein IMZ48_01630 [Candidatus Bathyarchaeota archaeon]|nr:hypothetical protein [Candidatus Bathyarchaeota archaeon]
MAKYYFHLVTLFDRHRIHSYVVEFSRLAIQFAHASPTDGTQIRAEMRNRQFNSAVAVSNFDAAHSALLAMTDPAVQKSSLRKLVEKMCESCHATELAALPFASLSTAVGEILELKSRGSVDVGRGVPYHQILYSWRISRNDYRGASSVLLDRIHKLKAAGEGDRLIGEDVLDTPVTRHYLLLINALSCVDPKQAWVFSEPQAKEGGKKEKRKVVTLADVRTGYQEELDRIAAIQNNQFGFGDEDAMEI